MKITKLRAERIKKGWTLEYVAEQVGVTKQAIQRIETRKCHPSYQLLIKLQKLFVFTDLSLLEQIEVEDTFSL